MMCAFDGPPRIVRLQGTGRVVLPDEASFPELAARFPSVVGTRAVIVIDVARVADSCGYGVPLMDHRGDRDNLVHWAESKGNDGLAEYRAERNATSLDGLPGL
jgi:hypothetical protein